MEIYLTTPQHERQWLNVDPNLGIPMFKRLLEEMTSIPIPNQIIYLTNNEITDDIRLFRNIAIAGDEFKVQHNGLITINVTSTNHENYKLKINPMTILTELRDQFETITHIPTLFMLIFYRQVEVNFCEKTLCELGALHNENIVIYDNRQALRIWVATSHTKSIIAYAPPFVSIIKVQEYLAIRTGVPVESQLFIHKKVDLSGINLTPQNLNIVNDAKFTFYDTRESIKISVRTSFQLGPPYIIEVKPHMEIRGIKQHLETLTVFPIAQQLISHNDINLTLPWQTFCQLEILTGAEILLGDGKDIIKYKIRKESGVLQDCQSIQHQTIGVLILAYLYKHDPRPNNTIKFLCRPTADGSPARFENALDKSQTLMDLELKDGDILCAGTMLYPAGI